MSTMVDNSRWDQRYQNQQGPITSGFVSNSDIRQKEKQEQIRLERQREYQDIMNKPREPNNSRQGSREQHQPPVYYKTGGVSELSLPLGNYEESRRVLDDERQREYNIYMTQKKDAENKRREDLYLNARQNYKAPPEPDMYDHNQISKDLREERQSEYNDYLDHPNMEYKHLEERRKMLSQERNNEYNEYLEKKKKKQSEESSRIRHRHRYTPPGGLPIGQYDLQRKKLQQQLRSEYKESLLKQRQDQLVFRAKEFQLDAAPEYLGNLNEERPLVGSPSPRNFSDLLSYQREKENMQSRRHVPPTPPGGLNIATEQERKQVENLKKAQYRDELLKQQKEQLYNTARQQGEIPVLNRSSPTRAPPDQISPRGRPPPHPDSVRQRDQPPQDDRMGQNHMEQSRQTPNFWDEGRQAPSPKSVEDEQATYNKSHVVDSQNKSKQNDRRPQEEIRTGLFDDRRRTPQNRDERQQDYQDYLADKLKKDEIRRQKLDEMRQAPQPGVNKGAYYDSDTYEQKRHSLNSQRREEYQDFLSKHYRHHTPLYGLPIGQYRYIPFRKSLEKQRNQEYNDYLEKQKEADPGRETNEDPVDFQTKRQNSLVRERNKEYNEFLEQRGQFRPEMADNDSTSNNMPFGKPHSERVLSCYKFSTDKNSLMNLRAMTSDHWNASLNINEDTMTARETARGLERKREYNNFLKSEMERKPSRLLTRERTPQGYGSLKFSEDYSARRENAYKSERNMEYNEYLDKEGLKLNPTKVEPLQLEEDFQTQRQKELAQERHQEYPQNPGSSRSKKESSSLTSLPLYQDKYDAHYKTLKQMRNEEYNQLLDETNRPSYRQYTPENMQGLPINQNRYDQAKRIQEQQRNREYNEHLAKKGEKITSEDNMLTKRDMTLKKYMDQQHKSEMQDKFRDFTQPEHDVGPPKFGLPIGQYKYEDWDKHQKEERTKEYQEILAQKSPDQRERRQWNDHSDPKGIIAGIDSYNYEKRKIFADERKQEYKDIMEKRNKPETDTQTYPEDTTKDESSVDRKPDMESINLNAVKIFPVGEGYTKKQRELQAERKKNDKAFALKKNEVYKKQKEDRDSFREMLDRELMESPPIIPNGEYDTKKRHFQQEAHKEMVHFLERQPHSNRDKEFWSKTAKPRILPQSGEYKNRKQKLNDELRKDWRDYILKQEPPKERIKEFGSPGAVLFTGEYEKTRQKVREERTKDYHEFMKKYGQQQPKRVPEQPPANSIGFMANLGFHDQERDKLNKEKRDEYNKFLDERSQLARLNVMRKIEDSREKVYGKDGMPRGRPNWVDGKDSWYNQEPPPFNKSPGPGRDQEPPRERPGSFNRRPSPSYQEILDSKRRQEASYRRFDDQEYSRLGGPQGGLGTDYSRP